MLQEIKVYNFIQLLLFVSQWPPWFLNLNKFAYKYQKYTNLWFRVSKLQTHFSKNALFMSCNLSSLFLVFCLGWYLYFKPMLLQPLTFYHLTFGGESSRVFTARNLSKYGVISGPYFPVFSPNTRKYGHNSIFGHFSRSVGLHIWNHCPKTLTVQFRRATSEGWGRGEVPLHFFENRIKVPSFWKNMPCLYESKG